MLLEDHMLPNSQNASSITYLRARALNPSTQHLRHGSVGLCVVHTEYPSITHCTVTHRRYPQSLVRPVAACSSHFFCVAL